ncbi:translation initiation factor IF-2 [Tepidibacillus marianensis]|uniref:translation initiation factor IF-2 n=1 Tax=Tepidibacillus marianensis TaxID=3131995 RepID=UPI00386CA11E
MNQEGKQKVEQQHGEDNSIKKVTKTGFEESESIGKTKKKTKPNQRRFDDNKVSNQRDSNQKNKGNLKRNKNNSVENSVPQQNAQAPSKPKTPKKIVYTGSMSVGELAKQLGKESSEIIKKLIFLGVMATINQEIELDAIQLVAEEYGIEVEEKIKVDETQFELIDQLEEEQNLKERPPVVTIMGHVDHGKTTLLDAIRHSKVAAGEAGGITQHIGAYQVPINGKKITFLDTPGHAAFTSMRARGTQVTDITILVVAADDGVMPQTIEAINHAKAANVPIIVAVNKIDKENANPDRVKQELTEHGLVPEDWGGDTIFVPLSALKQEGLDDLLEMILLVAEMQGYKANPNRVASGTIIESQLDKGRGAVATVLVQKGTLRVGDPIVAGTTYGKIRAMVNDRGKRIKEAGPSTPVEITGLNEVPNAGDPFIVFEEERKARVIGEKRAMKLRESELNATSRVTLDDLFKQIQEGEIKDLNVIIKGDVQGSVEALQGALEKIDIEGVRVKIIHKGVGAITETDVTLASASNAIVIGFNVRPEPQARDSAEREKVDVRLHRIIYNVIDEIEAALQGMLDPEYHEVVLGRAEIRQVFKASNIGIIAGSYVIEGRITRSASARVIRDGIVIFEGQIDSLKRFKDDAKEVAQGYECGITLQNFTDVKEGDVIEAFQMETVKK